MKKFFFFLFIFSTFLIVNTNEVNAKKLQAFLTYSSFYSPQQGSYLETYLSVYGKSVNFVKNQNGKYQATIEVTMIFKQNETIKDYKKYDLLSQETDDTLKINFNFVDQQRFALTDGKYTYELSIADKNSNNKPYHVSDEIILEYPITQVNVSGIELIESFKKTITPSIISKSGYDLIPYVSDFYPETIDKLTFYSEIYNSELILGKDDAFLVSYFIESYENMKTIPTLVKKKREQTKTVNVIFGEFDISRLPSGNYNLVIEARDKTNKILSFNKIFFQRSKPSIQFEIKDIAALTVDETFVANYMDKAILEDNIRSLYPISTEIERMFVNDKLKKADLILMQQYFFNFWLQRNGTDPENAWLNYKKEVDVVNSKFGTKVKRGYDTDRGRVYLEYGAPNEIVDRAFDSSSGLDESWGSIPYQIWHYYKLKNQANRKFVFANPNLALGDYELYHSDAIGEINDPNWTNRLSRSNDLNTDNDPRNPKGKAGNYFKNPR
jgi:GWxTD domain-containing protein